MEWRRDLRPFQIGYSLIIFHVTLSARIFLTLSCHASLSSIAFGRFSGATSRIGAELLYVGSSWTSCLCSSMGRGPQVYITDELVPTSPAVSQVSGLSNFDSFRYGLLVAVYLLLSRVLTPGLVQYCSQNSGVIAVKLFLHPFS